MRRILLGIALVGLVVTTAVLIQLRLTGDMTPVPVAQSSVQPSVSVWKTQVHYGFDAGIGQPIEERAGQPTLVETTMAGGMLIQMPRGSGWAVHFPARCGLEAERCPRAILESGPAGVLNPGSRPVRWGASVQMMSNETSEGGNVVQKGLSHTGTQFKLQVDGHEGRPSCVMSGAEGKFIALSTYGIADGKWHQLACERIKSQLTLYVDGHRIADAFVPAGMSIVNDAPLRLGGKGHGAYNDQFHGTIDDVFVDIA